MGDVSYSFYVGLGALILVVAVVVTAVIGLISPNPGSATARP
jgi:SSS family solute:Na+ symporter